MLDSAVTDMRSVRVTTREIRTVRGTARRSHSSLAIMSVTVQISDIGVLGYIGVL